MTEQESRIKEADEILEYIELTLLNSARFSYWEDRCRVADKIRELYKMATDPRINNAEH